MPSTLPHYSHFSHTIYYSVSRSSQWAMGSCMKRYCCCRRRADGTPSPHFPTLFLLSQLVLPMRDWVLHEAVLLLPPPPLVERRRYTDAPSHRPAPAAAAATAAPHAAA